MRVFYDAGCRYLQTRRFAYLCDPVQHDMLAKRGDDPEKQGEIYAGMINAALGKAPARSRRFNACVPWLA
jgi:5-methyltetrahydropteroyltriglutamate--homocysteine methyltransferase